MIDEIFDEIVSTFGGQIQSDGSFNIHCPCPEHEDTNPSCNVKHTGDKILAHCFAGCSQDAVISAFKAENLWPQKANDTDTNTTRPPGIMPLWMSRGSKIAKHISGLWVYKDQDGQILGYTARYDDHFGDKDVIPYFKKSGNQWKVGGPKGKPIYGIEYLKGNDKPVLIVEGEKARDAAVKLVGKDYICITWLGGTGSVNKVDWSLLNARDVYILPDNDKPGIRAAKSILSKIPNARIISPPADVPEKWDLADALEDGWTSERVSEHIKTAAVDPGPGGGKPSFNLESFSLSGMTKQMKQQMLDDVHILGRVALLGQLTIWFAKYNAGKTLLLLYLLIQSIRNGILKGEDVFYCNADDSYKGLVCKNELAEKYGFHQLAPGQGPNRENTFKSEKLIEYIHAMIDSGSVHGKLIILDTYKKFTDPMSKGKSNDFFSKLREFAMCGGSVVMLAHVNKHRDDDKKVVYEGVADGVNDPDCAYTLDIVSEGLDGSRTVRFDNFKSRGDVATEVSYSYDCTGSLTYQDRLASVKEVDEKDLKAAEKQRKARKELAKQRPIIDAITACIEEGITTKKALVKEAAIRCEKSQAKVTNVLRERTGSDQSKGHMWFTEPGQKNATHYRLNDQAPMADGEDLF